MPAEAKIYFIEDDVDFRETFKMSLEDKGHKVVLEAGDINSALSRIKEAQELGVDVGVLDGNLTAGVHNCNDGRQMAKALRETIPGIKIVAFSADKGADYGNVFVDKNECRTSAEKLTTAVTNI